MSRKKKPLVSLSTRREWLRQHEKEGRTPPEIAMGPPKYDVRTVRKQLDLARQEREEREASVLVLRDAKQKHYEDLIDYAGKLDKEIQQEPFFSTAGRIHAALKEHLPRSPFWKALDKLGGLNQEIQELEDHLQAAVYKLTNESIDKEAELFVEGIREALVHDLRYPEIELKITKQSTAKGYIGITRGAFRLGIVPENRITEAIDTINNTIAALGSSADSEALKAKLKERSNAIETIREELAIIIMKRIVPGRCKYCPF